MKRYFLLMLCCLWAFALTSTAKTADAGALSNMRVEISPLRYNGLYTRKLLVEQTFDITCTAEKEKIILRQDQASMIAGALWAHSLTTAVHVYHQWLSTPRHQLRTALSDLRFEVLTDGKKCTSYTYNVIDNTKGELTIPVCGKGQHTITVLYDFINNSNLPIYIMDTETRLSFSHFGGNWGDSWFFTTDNMRWGDIDVMVSDTLYFFSDVPICKKENTFRLYPTSTNDINLFFLDKKLYDRHVIDADYTKVDIYIQRTFQFEVPDKFTHITPCMPDSTLQQNLNNIREWVTLLEKFFADSVQRSICFIERDFTMMFDKKVSMGTALYTNPNSRIIVCDKNFWRSPHIAHELAHIFMDYRYEKDVRTLFGEAFVEYMATYVYDHQDPEKMEKTLAYYYNRLIEEQKALRILGQEHLLGINEQVAYSRVPYILHQFAQRIGFEHFIEILQRYYRHVRHDNITISLADFETFLKTNGVSDADWEWLYNTL